MGDSADRRTIACECCSFLLPLHPILRPRRTAPGAHARRCKVLLFSVDGDARALRFGHSDRQHAVLEVRLHLVVIDLSAQRDTTLEPAVEALAELRVLALGLRALLSTRVRTSSSSVISTSFSSSPGSSAVTRISVPVSETSAFGQPQLLRLVVGLGKRPMPNWSKPRNASSNSRLTSRCNAMKGSLSR